MRLERASKVLHGGGSGPNRSKPVPPSPPAPSPSSASEAEVVDVISRMAQFNRHRENAEINPKFKDEPWKDNGYVAWNLWGGSAGVDWAIRKMKKIRGE